MGFMGYFNILRVEEVWLVTRESMLEPEEILHGRKRKFIIFTRSPQQDIIRVAGESGNCIKRNQTCGFEINVNYTPCKWS